MERNDHFSGMKGIIFPKQQIFLFYYLLLYLIRVKKSSICLNLVKIKHKNIFIQIRKLFRFQIKFSRLRLALVYHAFCNISDTCFGFCTIVDRYIVSRYNYINKKACLSKTNIYFFAEFTEENLWNIFGIYLQRLGRV